MEGVTFTVLSIGLEKQLKPFPKHSHSKRSYELHYISYGHGTLIADDVAYEVTPGTFFMTGPGVAHEQIPSQDDPITEYGVYLQVNNSDMIRHAKYIPTFLEKMFWIGPAETGMHELMKQMIQELETHPFGYEFMLPALLQQLILMVSRQYRRDMDAPQGVDAVTISPADLTYLTIEEAFLYDYRNLTLESLAAQVNLGTRQTERLLQKHYNKTFQQKKTEARMSAACLLLQETGKSIASIAEELGYSSTEHFTNAFKKQNNMTPSAYRRCR